MLLVPWVLLVVGFEIVGFIEDPLLGAFVVHLTDASLPLGVGAGNPEADIGDHVGVMQQDSFAYGLNECAVVGESVSQLANLASRSGFQK